MRGSGGDVVGGLEDESRRMGWHLLKYALGKDKFRLRTLPKWPDPGKLLSWYDHTSTESVIIDETRHNFS